MGALAWLVLVTSVVWLLVAISTQVQRREQGRLRREIAKLTADACQYVTDANNARAFPTIGLEPVKTRRGEFGLLHETATLFDVRTRRYSTWAGTRLGAGALPIYLGGADSVQVQSLEPACAGDLYLSNQRLIFLSDHRSATVALKDVLAISGGLNALTVHSSKRQRPFVFSVANPRTWALLLRLFSSESISAPNLPDGLELRAEPTATPGEVIVTARSGEAAAQPAAG